MALWTQAESARIASTVAAVEARTSGEIVVAATPRSGDYLFERVVFGVVVGFGVALLVLALAPSLPGDRVLALELAAALFGYVLGRVPPVLRALVGRKRLERATSERALRAFAEHGVFDTRDRTGVLVFVSELERQAVLLGDKGIHARLGNEGWTRLVAELTASLRAHHGADGICRVVEAIGEVLARDLPPGEEDRNELPDAPIDERPARR